ncbi:hypothetical protein ACS0TY_014824 [Phlomoides rotata]
MKMDQKLGDMLKSGPKPTCSGGITEVQTGLNIQPSHGQSFFGSKAASGVGIGNFEEIGPLDKFLKPRNSTWLTKADLLFVDNPVGSGYSYVEDRNLLVKSDDEAATDLTTLLIEIFNKNETLQKKSYGGKFAVTLGLSALRAIDSGKLKLKLGGALALGDTWISPEDFVFSWGPLLKDVSRLDNNGLVKANSYPDTELQSNPDPDFSNPDTEPDPDPDPDPV